MLSIKKKYLLLIISILHTGYIYLIHNYIKSSKRHSFSLNPNTLEIKEDYFYFLQITDTHFSRKFTEKQDKNFLNFLEEISNLNYKFVIHTGDIFDSQDNFIGINKEDYLKYSELIKNKRFFNIRGNHDIFKSDKIINKEIQDILYNKERRNRNLLVKLNNKNILLRLLDGTPLNGTPKFYNFFGVLDDNYGIIESDLSINMCHYPINVLKSYNPSFYNCHAWFSGHFHTFFKYGDINKKSDKLESVLKDFYSNSVYRIIGVYKNNLSFNDVHLKKPKVLILNPIDKNLGVENEKENILKFLVFDFEKFVIKIDEKIYTNFTKEKECFSMKLPEKFSKIKVEAVNQFGTSFHEIDVKNGTELRPLPLNIPFFYLPFLLCGGYFLFHLAIFVYFKKIFYIFCLRFFYNLFLPTLVMKAHNLNHSFFTSTKAGLNNSFDIFYFHLIFCNGYDFILLISLFSKWYIIYLLFHLGIFLFFYKYYGLHFRPLEDFTFIFLICYFLYKKRIKSQIK